MRRRVLAAVLLILMALPAGAVDYTSTQSGPWSQASTWGGAGVPGIGDTAAFAASITVTLDAHRIRTDRLTWGGAGAALACTPGASLHLMSWTTPATTDWFVSEFEGDDTNTGAEEAMGATGPERFWATGMAHAAAGEHVLFSKGGTWFIAGNQSFVGGGTVGSFGQGDDNRYGPRPLWNLGATATLTQTGAAPTTQYHSEISCGDVLTAPPIMDRSSCVAPCALEVKVDVDHTHLPSTEPRLFDGTEMSGGADFILPTTVMDFGDPGSGFWEFGAASRTASPWPRNIELPAPIGFHTYQSPGPYTITTTTTYGGETVTNSIPVTILDPDLEWPGADTRCIANDGLDWSGCPAGATRVVSSSFDVSVNDITVDETTVRILYRRGDAFSIGDTTVIGNMTADWMLGYFGTGARVLLTVGSFTGDAIHFKDSTLGRIQGFEIVGSNNPAFPNSKAFFFISGTSGQCSGYEWDNLLIDDVIVRDYGNGYNAAANTTAGAQQYRPECGLDNIVLQDLQVLNAIASSQGGVDTFFFASSGAILGGDYGNRQSNEHGIRMKTVSDFVLGHTDLGRIGDASDGPQGCGQIRQLVTIRNTQAGSWEFKDAWCTGGCSGGSAGANDGASCVDDSVCTLGGTCDLSMPGIPQPCCLGLANGTCTNAVEDEMAKAYTQRFSIVDNEIGTCDPNAIGFAVEGTNNGNDEEFHHSYFFVGNTLNPSERTTTGAIRVVSLAGADVMIANNAALMDCGSATGSCRAFRLDNPKGKNGQVPNTAGQRKHVYNNSFYDTGNNLGNVEMISITTDERDTFVANNILVNLGSASFIIDNGTNTILCNDVGTACNVELALNTAFSSQITSAPPTNIDWFKLEPGYVAGSPVGVTPSSGGMYLDAFQRCRQSSTPWEGIDESGGAQCLTSPTTAPGPSLRGGSISGGSLSFREQIELMFQIVGVEYAR